MILVFFLLIQIHKPTSTLYLHNPLHRSPLSLPSNSSQLTPQSTFTHRSYNASPNSPSQSPPQTDHRMSTECPLPGHAKPSKSTRQQPVALHRPLPLYDIAKRNGGKLTYLLNIIYYPSNFNCLVSTLTQAKSPA